jgi:hypothetical protein
MEGTGQRSGGRVADCALSVVEHTPKDLKIMMMDKRNALAFEDINVHVRFKLFALWPSVMFFYIYGDYFELHQPGKLQEMISGRMAFGAVSQGVLLGMAAVMVIPSLMPFLSLVLPTGVNRWVNIVFGALYSVIMILAIRGGWHFYILFGLIEITLTVLIVWYAWTWPKQPTR